MGVRAQKLPPILSLVFGALLLLWLVVATFPFAWTLWGSFKVEGDFFSKADWTHALSGPLTLAEYGSAFTGAGYEGAWIKEAFWRATLNSFVVTVAVVVISLTFGTLGGYALSRSTYRYAFWLLLAALV
ncbi:MAG: hypothetical protein ACK5U4_17045, partial [Rhodospirillales bacterium]